jgi:hypothetical protein
MTIKTKAVGVRFPLELIERIERYRQERGVNFTNALVGLIERGLGGDEAEPIEASNNTLDKRITNLIETKLDAMLDERVKQALDAMLDSKNTPSDDSINSEFIAKKAYSECVTKCDSVEFPECVAKCHAVELGEESKAVTIENHPITEDNYTTQPKSFPFKAFHSYLDLTAPLKPNKTDADIAIAVAKSRGIHGWEYISKNRKFVNNS